MVLRVDVVDDALKSVFSYLGYQIGKRPGYFIIVPLLLTALAATGFQRIFYEADPEYLFSPTDGNGKYERSVLESYFPTNYSQYDPGRVSRGGRFGRLIVTAADGGNLLRTKLWEEILTMHELVTNMTIDYDDETLSWYDVCAKNNEYCWTNEILGIGQHMHQIESQEVRMTYPIWFDPFSFERYAFPFFVGGISLRNDSTLEHVTAINLMYFLEGETPELKKRGAIWEAKFIETLLAADPKFPNIKVDKFSSLTLEVELENNTNSVIPFFALNICIMIAFCIVTCMMTDWVKSKPILGLMGVISAIMATIVSFGLVIYCGMAFIGINLASPFLMLGIGIDDTFVMLGAWRRTSVHDTVPERMAQTFRDAAVSITITSITDMLSFFIGVITPFPCVQIFCVYTGACVAFTYLWHITFFGGCMAIAGYAEKQNRHSLTCLKVTPKSKSGNKNFMYRIFCSGGISPEDPFNKKDNAENAIMIFFRDYVAHLLNKTWFKCVIFLAFAVYLGGASYGISHLKEGLERRKLARFDSYSVDFYNLEDKYFRELPYRVNVVVSGRLDYSNPEVQADIEDLMQKLENTTFIDATYSESWLRDFVSYVERNKEYVPIDVGNESSFIQSVKDIYLDSGSSHYSQDVKFSQPDVHTQDISIIASRFLIQGAKIYNANDEKIFVEELREVCHGSKYNVTVFHPYFIYFDQFLIVLPTTIQCVTVAALVMMVISLIFIPNPICSLWVAFSIVSIELGVVGFMTLWGVSLDSISMINLIMCIGFSVDFSAHISYHFMSRSAELTPKERLVDSMYALGLPISQGAISTILGVVGLALAPSYVFITFFKMVFLVILLGALHGLLLLPILLSVFGPGACESKSRSNTPPSSLETTKIKIPRPSTTNSLNSMAGSSNGVPTPPKQRNYPHHPHRKTSQQRLHEMYTNAGYESEEHYISLPVHVDRMHRNKRINRSCSHR